MWWAFMVNFGAGFWLYGFWWTSVVAFGGGSGSGLCFSAWAADFCVGLRWRALGPFGWWTPSVDPCGGFWRWTSLLDSVLLLCCSVWCGSVRFRIGGDGLWWWDLVSGFFGGLSW